ncbi:hypothetical protein K1719_026012 [Acacia pycnantha]|nr:hypothetical protein K1719_026012 [Acacia pycnantha]
MQLLEWRARARERRARAREQRARNLTVTGRVVERGTVEVGAGKKDATQWGGSSSLVVERGLHVLGSRGLLVLGSRTKKGRVTLEDLWQSLTGEALVTGGAGFLVSHEEADDIVSGWKCFFAKKRAESEMKEGGDGETDRDDDREVASDSKYPVLSVTSDQYTTWCKPWMNSLIIKVLGWSVPKHVLMDRVRRMWKPKQPLKVVPLSNEYYIVSFSSKEDRDYAYYEGPWMINDHYLLVQCWRPNFNPGRADCQRKVAVWIRIPDLPLEFCSRVIGNNWKYDREDKQLVYEGLHLVCFNCGRYGHDQEQCANGREEVHTTPPPCLVVGITLVLKWCFTGICAGHHQVWLDLRRRRGMREELRLGAYLVGDRTKSGGAVLGVYNRDVRDPGKQKKYESIEVGSKRKKDDGPKGFGKENKPRPKPKTKTKSNVNPEAQGVELLNTFTVLQGPISVEENQRSGGPSDVSNNPLPSTPITRQHADGNCVVVDMVMAGSSMGPAGGVVEKNGMANYLGNGLGPTSANQF